NLLAAAAIRCQGSVEFHVAEDDVRRTHERVQISRGEDVAVSSHERDGLVARRGKVAEAFVEGIPVHAVVRREVERGPERGQESMLVAHVASIERNDVEPSTFEVVTET